MARIKDFAKDLGITNDQGYLQVSAIFTLFSIAPRLLKILRRNRPFWSSKFKHEAVNAV